MKIITDWKKIIKCWCNNPEQGAIDQAINLSNLPFIYKYVALMADTHQWYWMPIGWVIATKWVIIPNAVWVDIWCGMIAVKTSLATLEKETIKNIIEWIKNVIPVWFNRQSELQDKSVMPEYNTITKYWVVWENYEKARWSIWTLWWWNHFIEIQEGSDWYIWIMVHSWSRNLWKQVADYYNKVAKELNKQYHTLVPKEYDLAFLPIDSEEWQDYIGEMNYCVNYALANRQLMMERIKEVFKNNTPSLFEKEINIAHNYARLENHWWGNVWVHRKWATSAREWELWIIPGSQWTKSYIVRWKGNKESFMSCSHWAWRNMSRTQAIKQLDLEAEIKLLDDQWIIHWIRSKKDLDEASSAYKDIDVVMEEQKDLVDIVVELTPLAVIKW